MSCRHWNLYSDYNMKPCSTHPTASLCNSMKFLTQSSFDTSPVPNKPKSLTHSPAQHTHTRMVPLLSTEVWALHGVQFVYRVDKGSWCWDMGMACAVVHQHLINSFDTIVQWHWCFWVHALGQTLHCEHAAWNQHKKYILNSKNNWSVKLFKNWLQFFFAFMAI